jgi:ATP synthase I chain
MTDGEKPEDSLPGESRGEEPVEAAPEDWPESQELGWAETSTQEMAVCRATLRRIEWMIGIAGAVCALAVVWPLGWQLAAGMLLGTVLGWINFRWLAASVNAIGERIVKVKSRERGAAIVARGIGRILLIALVAYGIFACSVQGLMGFLAGLAMPVIAMMCEAVYEFVATIRRPS